MACSCVEGVKSGPEEVLLQDNKTCTILEVALNGMAA